MDISIFGNQIENNLNDPRLVKMLPIGSTINTLGMEIFTLSSNENQALTFEAFIALQWHLAPSNEGQRNVGWDLHM